MKTVVLLVFGCFMLGSTEHNLSEPSDAIILFFVTVICAVDDIANGLPKFFDNIKKWKDG